MFNFYTIPITIMDIILNAANIFIGNYKECVFLCSFQYLHNCLTNMYIYRTILFNS